MAQNSQNQEMMMKMAQMMQQGMMGMGQQQMAAQQQRYDDQVARSKSIMRMRCASNSVQIILKIVL